MIDRLEGFRLSPQQRRLWSWPEAYREVFRSRCGLRLEGTLQIEALQRALRALTERHEVLRTAYVRQPGIQQPIQVTFEASEPRWQMLGLEDLDPARRQERIDEAWRQPIGFEGGLETEWSLRPVLLKLAPESHLLLLDLPPLGSDRRTLEVLPCELAELYLECLGDGRDLEASVDESIQYVQFSEWLHELGSEPDAEGGFRFWRRLPTAEASELGLPFVEVSEVVEASAPSRRVVAERLDPRFEQAARALGSELPVWILGCWGTLLSRLAQRRRTVVGQLFSGRKFDELASIPGLFGRFLPIVIDYDPKRSSSDQIAALSESLAEAERWQDFADGSGDEDERPSFAVLFEIAGRPAAAAGGLRIDAWRTESVFEPFAIKLLLQAESEGHKLELHYDPQQLHAEDVERLGTQLLVLLADAAERPRTGVGHLQLLGPAERQLLIEEFNNTTDSDRRPPVHRRIEEWAKKAPDATALDDGSRTLSFGRLDRLGNALAARLIEAGIGRGDLVAICVERSPEMVVALLAVLKSGAAYLPIDADYPKLRIEWLLGDARSTVLITERPLLERLPADAARPLFVDGLDAEAAAAPTVEVEPEDLAYVIYTSGSSGRPKGVMMPHRGLSNYVAWAVKAYRLADGGSSLVHSPIGFDLTVTSIFAPMMAGQAAVLIAEDRGVEGLAEEIANREDLSLVKLTPSHLEILAEMVPDSAAGPKVMVLGGEALRSEQVSALRFGRDRIRFFNEYGPAEAAVGCCVHETGFEAPAGPIPIGRPIANARIYLVDAQLQPVATGVPGELWIGGAGLARGYLRRPAITAGAFIPDPFSGARGARLYRSGDRARFLRHGALEYLGRIDHQLKIRGHRIEPGEIEAALRDMPPVRDALVVASPGAVGQAGLTAYLLAADGQTPDAQALRDELMARLPEFMVPGAFVTLEAWPLNANGKLDRAALPSPEAAESSREYVAPRNADEKIMVDIWCRVLNRDRVGVFDNFFELGGDSILGVQAIARAQQAGIKLTSGQLFEHQNIVSLLAVAGRAEPSSAEQGPVSGPVPLTPIQHWFFERDLPSRHHWNQSVMVRVAERLQSAALEGAVEALLRHHDALRARFRREASGWQQWIPEIGGAALAAEVFVEVDLADAAPEEQRLRLEAHAARLQASLDLERGPLLKVACFDFGAADPAPMRLLLIVHHLVIDAVSWQVLLDDLQHAYADLASGREPRLPAKTTSYREWAGRLVELADSEELRAETAHWRAVTENVPELPHDGPGGANDRASERTVSVELTEDETRALLEDVPSAYHTQVNDVLLTALILTLERWTGRADATLMMEGHGREELADGLDLSRTVGWFTCQYPVRLRLADSEDAGGAIKSVKEQLRQIPRRGLGYGLLRYLDASSTGWSAFEPVLGFNYLGRLDRAVGESALFSTAEESAGEQHDPQGPRQVVLALSGGVFESRLRLNFTYSRNLHLASTIEDLAETYLAALRRLIEHCVSRQKEDFTPSDFPKAKLSQEKLGRVLDMLADVDAAAEGADTVGGADEKY